LPLQVTHKPTDVPYFVWKATKLYTRNGKGICKHPIAVVLISIQVSASTFPIPGSIARHLAAQHKEPEGIYVIEQSIYHDGKQ
jgi:hypothetical protein